MARFYSKIATDTKSPVIRTAHKKFVAEIMTYNSGVRVEAYIDGEGKEIFNIFRTNGSNSNSKGRLIGFVKDGEFHREITMPSIVPD